MENAKKKPLGQPRIVQYLQKVWPNIVWWCLLANLNGPHYKLDECLELLKKNPTIGMDLMS